METREKNILIAEFMWGRAVEHAESFDPYDRADVWDVPDDGRGVFWSLSCYYEETGQHIEAELFFHMSWDWLMPVIEKLYNIGVSRSLFVELNAHLGAVNIKEAHKCTVEIIQWYNTRILSKVD